MKFVIRAIDRRLRRKAGIFEFSDDPMCFLRLRVTRSERALRVPGGEIPAGEKVLDLHLWNERVPRVPAGGPDLAWSIDTHRRLMFSFQEVARYLKREASLSDVAAIGGRSVLFEGIMAKAGFEVVAVSDSGKRFVAFWDDLYSWLLIWAFSPVSLPSHPFARLRRWEYWTTREAYLERFLRKDQRQQKSTEAP
jgi:hypothetical protein